MKFGSTLAKAEKNQIRSLRFIFSADCGGQFSSNYVWVRLKKMLHYMNNFLSSIDWTPFQPKLRFIKFGRNLGYCENFFQNLKMCWFLACRGSFMRRVQIRAPFASAMTFFPSSWFHSISSFSAFSRDSSRAQRGSQKCRLQSYVEWWAASRHAWIGGGSKPKIDRNTWKTGFLDFQCTLGQADS